MKPQSDNAKRVVLNIIVFGLALLVVFLLGKLRTDSGLLDLVRGDFSTASVLKEGELNTARGLLLTDVPTLAKQDTEITKIVDLVTPNVVSVTTSSDSPFDRSVDVEQGSGVIITEQGHVVTNFHVVSSDKSVKLAYTVELYDGTLLDAELVGVDVDLDLAVLKIDSEEKFKPIAMADSDEVLAGQKVYAFGSPYGLGVSFSEGNVAARFRFLNEVQHDPLQTTAAINPGQSGGPLVNIKGELIGVNSSIYSRNKVSGFQGIAFAIRANDVKASVWSMLKRERPTRGYIGLEVANMTESARKQYAYEKSGGVLAVFVRKNSPADKAGIKRGDIITKFNERSIVKDRQLVALVKRSANKKVEIEFFSQGEEKKMEVQISEWAKLKEEILTNASAEELANIHASVGLVVEDFTTIHEGYKINGVRIKEVIKQSKADRRGLKPGDMVRFLNGRQVKDVETFKKDLEVSVLTGQNPVLKVERIGLGLSRNLLLPILK